MRPAWSSLTSTLLAVTLLSWGPAGVALGEENGPPEGGTPETGAGDVANYAYTQDMEIGSYSVGDQQVQTVRLPIGLWLRRLQEKPWGVRLKLPLSFGVYAVDLPDIIEGFLTDRVKTLTLVPALEFHVPVRGGWVVKPYQELGLGKDFEGGDLLLLAATGVKTVNTWPWKKLELSLGGGAKLSLSRSSSGLNDDDFAVGELGFDARFPLGFKIKDLRATGSAYLIGRYFFRELVFQAVDSPPVVVERQLELGVTFGTTPRGWLWKLRVPRIGVGYRVGDGLRGVRVNFGFPF